MNPVSVRKGLTLACLAGALLVGGAVDGAGSRPTQPDGALNAGFVQDPAGQIAGTVRAADTGGGLAGLFVAFVDPTGTHVGSATTDAEGHYTTSLPAGTYFVHVHSDTTRGYAGQLFGGVQCLACDPATGTPVVVASGVLTDGIDLTLTKGGWVTGRVTAAATGAGIEGVWISFNDAAGNYVHGARTDAAGDYTMLLLPGVHYASSVNSGYVDQMFQGLPAGTPFSSATPISVSPGATTTGIDFTLASGRRVRGRVTDATTGLGVSDIWVDILDATGRFLGSSARTTATGEYESVLLPPGTYFARTNNAREYINETWQDLPANAPTASGTPIVVTASGDTGGVDFALERGGQISGRIRDALTGAGVPNAWVEINDANWQYKGGSGWTTDSGAYLTGGLPPGTYYVRVNNAQGYVGQFYSGQPFAGPPTIGTPVVVRAGEVTTGIDAALTPGSRITGTVTVEPDGQPVGWAYVSVHTADGVMVGANGTDQTGRYTVSVPAGTFYVRVWDNDQHVQEVYDNVSCPAGTCSVTSGTPVVVGLGETAANIDFALAVGGTITGRVTDAVTGAGVAGVWVDVFDATGRYVRNTAHTDGSGTYVAAALPTGTYFLRTNNSGAYLNVLYPNLPSSSPITSGVGVAVTAGETTANVDFALVAGRRITGRVVDAATGQGIAGVWVDIRTPDGQFLGSSAPSDASGGYVSMALPPGTYYPTAANSQGYINCNYAAPPANTCGVPNAPGTPVTLTADADVTGIDFALVRGGAITGRVTDAATGLGVSDIWVDILDATGRFLGSSARTTATGEYESVLVPPGTYFARTNNAREYINETWQDLPASTPTTSGTPIVVTSSGDTEGVDFALERGGQISGRIRDALTGAGVPNAWVEINDANWQYKGGSGWTTDSGAYLTGGLPPGTYYVRVNNAQGYVGQFYSGQPFAGPPTIGTPVVVRAGEVTTGIDAALMPGSRITGTVTIEPDGQPVGGAYVSAHTADGTMVGANGTDQSGRYTVSVPAGTFYVRVWDNDQHVQELYDNVPCPAGTCSVTSGTPVVVGLAETAANIDFALAVGGTITGRVTDAATGAGVAGVWVDVFDATGRYVRNTAQTDGSGTYVAPALPTGTYFLRTNNSGAYLNVLYPNLPSSSPITSGVGVAVTASETTANVDFALVMGRRITGRVVDAATGQGIAGVWVDIRTPDGQFLGSSAPSDASGAYVSMALPPGTYYPTAANSQGYINCNYAAPPANTCGVPNAPGTAVTLTADADVTGIDFALVRGGAITGRVTDAVTGLGLGAVQIGIRNSAGSTLYWFSTDGGGYYTAAGLPEGSYYVVTETAPGYTGQLYNHAPWPFNDTGMASGTSVAVAAGTTVAGIDFSLTRGGTVSGQVVDETTGEPVAGMRVVLIDANGLGKVAGTTDAGGRYRLDRGAPDGTYYIRTWNQNGYIDELHPDIPCLVHCAGTSGTPIVIAGTGTIENVDFSIARGGRISGRATEAATGHAAPGVKVVIYSSQPTYWSSGYAGETTTNGEGYWISPWAYPTGTYFAKAGGDSIYPGRLYDGIVCGTSCNPRSGTPIPVVAGQGAAGIDFQLDVGGTITGRAIDASTGAPLTGASIQVRCVTGSSSTVVATVVTDAEGRWRCGGLEPGAYYVRTAASSLGYLDEQYDDAPCPAGSCSATSGTAVSVTQGGVSTGIDFSLARGWRITGTVTNAATHAGVSSVSVRVYGPSGSLAATATSNTQGAYSTSPLAAGTYFLRTSNTAGYVDQVYDGLVQLTTSILAGTPVSLGGSPPDVTVNFALSPGGRISGVVTDANTGGAVAKATVLVYSESGSSVGSATTDSAGRYTAPTTGLPAGTYFARASASGYAPQVFNGRTTAASPIIGSPIAVAQGATTTGVDFSLAAGGTIAGSVTDATTLAPLAGVTVTAVYAETLATAATAVTNASGSYSIGGLLSGSYYVRTGNRLGYIDEVYPDEACIVCTASIGGRVSVLQGQVTSGIDLSLDAAPTAPNDSCAEAVVIQAAPFAHLVSTIAATQTADEPAQSCGWTGTGRSVWYRFTPPADGLLVTHTVGSTFDTVISVHAGACGAFTEVANACYDDIAPSLSIGSQDFGVLSVPVIAGITYAIQVAAYGGDGGTLHFNLDFRPSATISGHVWGGAGGTPLAGATVEVFGTDGQTIAAAITDGSGAYRTQPLQEGTYFARTRNDLGFVDQIYSNTPCTPSVSPLCDPLIGTPISVVGTSPAENIDFRLDPGGRISGSVTDRATGAPVVASVRVVDASGRQVTSWIASSSSTTGAFLTPAVPPGTYFILSSNSSGYVDRAYDDVAHCLGQAGCPSLPTPVSVTAGTITPGIDLHLSKGGRVAGAVVDAGTLMPVQGVAITIVDAAGREVARATSGSSGAFAVNTGLAAGTYFAVTDNAFGYLNQVYGGGYCQLGCDAGSGSPIAVADNRVTSGIVFELSRGARITGQVVEQGSLLPVAGIEVQVLDGAGAVVSNGRSDGSGRWTTRQGLPAGTYRARTDPSPRHAMQLYAGDACPGGGCAAPGTPIVTGERQTASGIDFVLPVCEAGLSLEPTNLPPARQSVPYSQVTGGSGGTGPYGIFATGARLYEAVRVFLGSLPSGMQVSQATLNSSYMPLNPAPGVLYSTAPVMYETFRLTGGVLPPGLGLDEVGRLSGTPTLAGIFSFTLGTVDGRGCGVTRSYQLTVDPAGGDAPVISSVTPGSGPVSGGTVVTITGTGFHPVPVVTLGGVVAALGARSETSIIATTGAHPVGPVDVVVTNPDGQSGTLVGGFTYAPDTAGGTAQRMLPACYVGGVAGTVTVGLAPGAGVSSYAVEDAPPALWTVGSISDGGVFDAVNGKVKWGPFFDDATRTLTYAVTPPAGTSGAGTFTGLASFDGLDVVVDGTGTLDACQAHPSDTNGDWRIVIGEMTTYGAAWKRGDTWPTAPNPIPIGFVTRAGYLWRVGETYHRDAGTCPTCWTSGAPGGQRWAPIGNGGASASLAEVWARVQGRAVPGARVTVTLEVVPPSGTQAWAVEDRPPAGWFGGATASGGTWVQAPGVVRWGPFFDDAPRTLTYDVVMPERTDDALAVAGNRAASAVAGDAGPVVFAGAASFDGVDVPVGGARTLRAGPRPTFGDFNGNGKADLAVVDPATGVWTIAGVGTVETGMPGATPVPADYDGDGRTDVAMFDAATGTWRVVDQFVLTHGEPGDIPVPADFDGDGRADVAVFRPATGTWFVAGESPIAFGRRGDVPVPADYDGDGIADLAVFRPATGEWFIVGQAPRTWGELGDVPVPGDYDGDGVTDVAIYRPATGDLLVQGRPAVTLGHPGGVPAALDVDGDRVADLCSLTLAGAWRCRQSGTGTAVERGLARPGDRPVFGPRRD